jgi:hypothetical protein
MIHLTEDEMIDQAYGEGAGDAKQHLEACQKCAAAFAALRADLADVEAVEAPVRDAGYGEAVWRAIGGALPAYERRRQSSWQLSVLRGLSYASVCALVAAGAFYAGQKWERSQQKAPPVIANSTQSQPPVKQPVIVVVLSDHLDRSERLLVELKHVDADSAELISPLRDEARSLLAANRVCRHNASQDDDPALTTALDRLDHVLNELANQPGGLNAATITRLQDEMNADGLLFEVRVLRSRIPDRQMAGNAARNGGTI